MISLPSLFQFETKAGKAAAAAAAALSSTDALDPPDLKVALKREREEHQHLLAESYAAVMDLTKQVITTCLCQDGLKTETVTLCVFFSLLFAVWLNFYLLIIILICFVSKFEVRNPPGCCTMIHFLVLVLKGICF